MNMNEQIPVDTFVFLLSTNSNSLEAVNGLMEAFVSADYRAWLEHAAQDSRIHDKLVAYANDATMPAQMQENSDILVNLIARRS